MKEEDAFSKAPTPSKAWSMFPPPAPDVEQLMNQTTGLVTVTACKGVSRSPVFVPVKSIEGGLKLVAV